MQHGVIMLVFIMGVLLGAVLGSIVGSYWMRHILKERLRYEKEMKDMLDKI